MHCMTIMRKQQEMYSQVGLVKEEKICLVNHIYITINIISDYF